VTPKTLSAADRLVLAASSLGSAGTAFTAEDLVVAAWRQFPGAFGLRGYLNQSGDPIYPDSNRVFAEIMGTKPGRSRGWIEKVGNKTYRLTEAGRRRVEELQGAESPRRAAIDRRSLDEYRRLLGSRAIHKFRNGLQERVTFHDACAFWGLSPRSNAKDLAARVNALEALMRTLEEVEDDSYFVRRGPDIQGKEQVLLLRTAHEAMLARFATELDVIRRRGTER